MKCSHCNSEVVPIAKDAYHCYACGNKQLVAHLRVDPSYDPEGHLREEISNKVSEGIASQLNKSLGLSLQDVINNLSNR